MGLSLRHGNLNRQLKKNNLVIHFPSLIQIVFSPVIITSENMDKKFSWDKLPLFPFLICETHDVFCLMRKKKCFEE